jgi:hypothetical protein
VKFSKAWQIAQKNLWKNHTRAMMVRPSHLYAILPHGTRAPGHPAEGLKLNHDQNDHIFVDTNCAHCEKLSVAANDTADNALAKAQQFFGNTPDPDRRSETNSDTGYKLEKEDS